MFSETSSKVLTMGTKRRGEGISTYIGKLSYTSVSSRPYIVPITSFAKERNSKNKEEERGAREKTRDSYLNAERDRNKSERWRREVTRSEENAREK